MIAAGRGSDAAECIAGHLVEARRDGRLAEAERSSIERHLAFCEYCRAHDGALARITELARAMPVPGGASATTLDQRRGRMRLLQAAALLDGPTERTTLSGLSAAAVPARIGWAAPGAAAALAVLALVSACAGRSARPTAAALAMRPSPCATSESVAQSAAPAAPASVVSHDGAAVSPEPPPRAEVSVPHRRASSSVRRAAPVVTATAPASPLTTAEASIPPEHDLAAGMGSMARGDFGEAVERLGAFRKSHPADSRAEDAAFLVIVALQRAGRHGAAASAAREYLASYPSGYRRDDARRIAARTD